MTKIIEDLPQKWRGDIGHSYLRSSMKAETPVCGISNPTLGTFKAMLGQSHGGKWLSPPDLMYSQFTAVFGESSVKDSTFCLQRNHSHTRICIPISGTIIQRPPYEGLS